MKNIYKKHIWVLLVAVLATCINYPIFVKAEKVNNLNTIDEYNADIYMEPGLQTVSSDAISQADTNSVSSNSVSANQVSDNSALAEISADNNANSSRYELYVNRGLNVVTVYENKEDGSREAIKAFACSCGKPHGHNTPQGTFYTSDTYRWRRMIDNTYAQYAVRVNKLIMFHSVPYKEMKPNTLKWAQYNLLGSKASLGCIRLSVSDVKWIYDNCLEGTKVVIYEDMDEELPIEKPATFKISYDMNYRGWDPTDPDPDNPWNNSKGE